MVISKANALKSLSWVSTIGLAVVMAIALSVAIKRTTAQEAVHVVPPYQIWFNETLMDAKNPVVEQYDYFRGQNSKGDWVELSMQERLRTIGLLGKGLIISYTAENKQMMTGGTGVPQAPQWLGDQCQGYVGLTGESKIILNFVTLKIIHGALPTGLETAWLAPALNCQALREEIRWTYNGAPDGVTTKFATKAIAEEPDPTLFVIPANVTEVPPSAFWPPLGRSPDKREEDLYNMQKAKRALPHSSDH
jgi:hypothetical protein